MSQDQVVQLSKFLSLLLRHKPEILNLNMDKHGFVRLSELLQKIKEKPRWQWVDRKRIEKVLNQDPKRRFEVQTRKNHLYVRATYGHSETLPITIHYPSVQPSHPLYHGTQQRKLESIMETGLQPMSRKYVHLSANVEDALKVANRRKGSTIILKIKAKSFIEQGGTIYKATDRLYLSPRIPPSFLKIEQCT